MARDGQEIEQLPGSWLAWDLILALLVVVPSFLNSASTPLHVGEGLPLAERILQPTEDGMCTRPDEPFQGPDVLIFSWNMEYTHKNWQTWESRGHFHEKGPYTRVNTEPDEICQDTRRSAHLNQK
jgi:hypothetical protein